jgi:hypothetical protein
MGRYFDRYNNFRKENEIKPIPGLFVEESPSDKKIIYKLGDTRLDKVSNIYYNSPYYGWLIMLANPEYGGLEFNIPDQTVIRVPFPLDSGLERYSLAANKYISLYGGR